jgi:hypothetical protein
MFLNTFAFNAWLLTYCRAHSLLNGERLFTAEESKMILATLRQFSTLKR